MFQNNEQNSNILKNISKFLLNKTYQFGTTFAAKRQGVVAFIPLSEWGSVNGHNGVLHQSFGSHQLVVGCIVDDIDDTSLACASFRSPREVTGVQTKGTVFFVSSTCADLEKKTNKSN